MATKPTKPTTKIKKVIKKLFSKNDKTEKKRNLIGKYKRLFKELNSNEQKKFIRALIKSEHPDQLARDVEDKIRWRKSLENKPFAGPKNTEGYNAGAISASHFFTRIKDEKARKYYDEQLTRKESDNKQPTRRRGPGNR